MKCKPELLKCEHCDYIQRTGEYSFKCLIEHKDKINFIKKIAQIEAINSLRNLRLTFKIPEEK